MFYSMAPRTVMRRSIAGSAGLTAGFLFGFVPSAEATKWTPLQDATYKYLCVDLDSVRTDSNGWTRYTMSYCDAGARAMHDNKPIYSAVKCADALPNLSTSNYDVRLLFADGRLVSTERGSALDGSAVLLVCPH